MSNYKTILGHTILAAFVAASAAEANDIDPDVSYIQYSSAFDQWQQEITPVQGIGNCLYLGLSHYMEQVNENYTRYDRPSDRDATYQCLNDNQEVVQQVYYYWTKDKETQTLNLHSHFFYPMPKP